jgi:hypothetical protein
LANGVVDVRAERLPALIAVEKRRKDLQRQRRRHKQRVVLQRREDQLAHLARRRMILRQLHVVFRPRRLAPGCDSSVNPIGLFQLLPAMRDLLGGQDVGNMQ